MATSRNMMVSHYGEPASAVRAVTPTNGVDLSITGHGPPRALYIGVSGDVSVIALDDEREGNTTAVIFKAVPVGILPVRCFSVEQTATTATNIVALY